jgi:hypothetical protein
MAARSRERWIRTRDLRLPEASAHPIRECGNAGTLYGGAVNVYNVTSRAVGCRDARRFARRYIRYIR